MLAHLRKHPFVYLLVLLLVAGMLVYRFADIPHLWFDEGWSLSLARNWVELGHYGHLQSGEPVPATVLNAGFPFVAPLALSFKLFGVGVWQGRLPGVLFTLGGVCALYYLAARLYSPAVGVAAVLVSLLLPIYPDLHPVYLGRQALGEMPAVFYLLVGYALLLHVWDKSPALMALPSLFWALSLRTKPQVFPFIILSMVAVIALSALLKSGATTRRLLLGLALTVLFDRGLAWLWARYVGAHTLAQRPSTDPYTVLADMRALFTYVIVLYKPIRIATLRGLLLFAGLLPFLGLLWNGGVLWKEVRKTHLSTIEDVTRLMFWVLVVGWYLWHHLLSIGWLRYLFPGAFLGSIHLAVLLQAATGNYSVRRTLDRAAALLVRGSNKLASLGTIAMAILVAVAALRTLTTFVTLASTAPAAVEEVATYLNTRADPEALIETYESELYFLLERPYHFPPDEVQHDLNRCAFFDECVAVNYDPLVQDPGYIVTGFINGLWGLYDTVLQSGGFTLIHESGPYRIYERHR